MPKTPYFAVAVARQNSHKTQYELPSGNENKKCLPKDLCSDNDFIFVQEHWLLESQLYMFDNINDNFNFYGKSSMDEATSRGLLKGRPFGGVGVLW